MQNESNNSYLTSNYSSRIADIQAVSFFYHKTLPTVRNIENKKVVETTKDIFGHIEAETTDYNNLSGLQKFVYCISKRLFTYAFFAKTLEITTHAIDHFAQNHMRQKLLNYVPNNLKTNKLFIDELNNYCNQTHNINFNLLTDCFDILNNYKTIEAVLLDKLHLNPDELDKPATDSTLHILSSPADSSVGEAVFLIGSLEEEEDSMDDIDIPEIVFHDDIDEIAEPAAVLDDPKPIADKAAAEDAEGLGLRPENVQGVPLANGLLDSPIAEAILPPASPPVKPELPLADKDWNALSSHDQETFIRAQHFEDNGFFSLRNFWNSTARDNPFYLKVVVPLLGFLAPILGVRQENVLSSLEQIRAQWVSSESGNTEIDHLNAQYDPMSPHNYCEFLEKFFRYFKDVQQSKFSVVDCVKQLQQLPKLPKFHVNLEALKGLTNLAKQMDKMTTMAEELPFLLAHSQVLENILGPEANILPNYPKALILKMLISIHSQIENIDTRGKEQRSVKENPIGGPLLSTLYSSSFLKSCVSMGKSLPRRLFEVFFKKLARYAPPDHLNSLSKQIDLIQKQIKEDTKKGYAVDHLNQRIEMLNGFKEIEKQKPRTKYTKLFNTMVTEVQEPIFETIFRHHNLQKYIRFISTGFDFFDALKQYSTSQEKRKVDPKIQAKETASLGKHVDEVVNEGLSSLLLLGQEIQAVPEYGKFVAQLDLALTKAEVPVALIETNSNEWLEKALATITG